MQGLVNTPWRLARRALRPYPVNGPAEILSCQPFFILSSGRSGSTLLRAILMEDPTLCIPPESHVLQRVVTMYRRYYRYLPWRYVVNLVVADFASAPGNPKPGFVYWQIDLAEFYPRAYALSKSGRRLDRLIDLFYGYYRERKKPGATRWGDKSIENAMAFSDILGLFPGAQFIHLVRDGRDVVASLVQHEIARDLPKACDHWRKTTTSVARLGKSLSSDQFLTVFYEELVRNPGKCVETVCDFLGITYHPRLLEFWKRARTLGDTDRCLHKDLNQPINDRGCNRWRERLDPGEQRLVSDLLGDTLREFGIR